jgi:hypothetical protein
MVKELRESQQNMRCWVPYGKLISEILHQGGILKVQEEMYGGALVVARSRKSKRKETSKEEYLEAEQPSKKAKKEKASDKLKIGGSGLPTIQEEVQDLNTDVVLNKRTRSGKAAASSQTAPEQPPVPKKKKTAIRMLKESAYVEEEDIVANTKLVTREVKRKKAEDAAALQKALEIAKETEIPASSFTREDVVTDAQEIVRATKDLQELVASEAKGLMMVATKGVQEDNTGGSEATAPEACERGNPDFYIPMML